MASVGSIQQQPGQNLEIATESPIFLNPGKTSPFNREKQSFSAGLSGDVNNLEDPINFYETEPNDTFAQANVLNSSQIGADPYLIAGMINDGPSDTDIFRLQLSQNGAFYVEAIWAGTYYEAGLDNSLKLSLFSGDEWDLLEGFESGRFFVYLPAGTYYVILRTEHFGSSFDQFVGEPYLMLFDFFPDVSIPDQNLKSRLLDVMGILGRGITEWDMYHLETLDIRDRSIRNLTGLETAVNLKEMDAAANQITSLSPLAGLGMMERLDLSENTGLVNVSPLAGLTNMKDLRLYQTRVEDISMLGNLTGLNTLYFSDTKVFDLSVLSNFPNIQNLFLGSERLCDLTPLADLSELKELLIINSPLVTDLSPLSALTQIEWLAIVGTLVSDITPLAGLIHLWDLSLSHNRIEDISPLSGMTSLVSLALRDNEIRNIGTLLDILGKGALPEHSLVDLRENELDLAVGSPAMNVIQLLEADGVEVLYYPQKWVSRIAGINRYRTAIEVSREGWLHGAETVIVARGDNYADALAGVPLAYQLNAPILLTATSQIGASTLIEIKRLDAKNAIILGGTGAVSADVEAALTAEGLTVQRIGGESRYQTAVNIAQAMLMAGAAFDTAVVAVGTNFPDALAAASYAAIEGQPILLTGTQTLSGTTRSAIESMSITNTIIVGGTSVISLDVEDDLDQYGSVVRLSGANRYETAISIAQHYNCDTDRYYIATGLDFPDAITGAVLAANRGTGVLLVYGSGTTPNPVVQNYVANKLVQSVGLFGGTSVISDGIMGWFENNLY